MLILPSFTALETTMATPTGHFRNLVLAIAAALMLGAGSRPAAAQTDEDTDAARTATDSRVGWFGSFIELDSRNRVVVTSVTPDTQASKAGIAPGDTILSAEGQVPSTLTGLIGFTSKLVTTRKPGDEIAVKIARGGREQTVLLQVGEASTVAPPDSDRGGGQRFPAVLGIAVKERGPYVIVTQVINNEPAAIAGIRPDDIILGVVKQKIISYATLASSTKPFRPGDRVPIEILREQKQGVVTVKVGTRKVPTADVVLDSSEDIVEIVAEVKRLKSQVRELTIMVTQLSKEVAALKGR